VLEKGRAGGGERERERERERKKQGRERERYALYARVEKTYSLGRPYPTPFSLSTSA